MFESISNKAIAIALYDKFYTDANVIKTSISWPKMENEDKR